MHSIGASSVIFAYYLALLIFAVAVAAMCVRFGWLRTDLQVEDRTRVGNLDGLRGILAISVFIHHSFFVNKYYLFGPWAPPVVALTLWLGTAPVALFFMITGFLFWTRVLRERGRLSVTRLYRSRFLRLWPLYAASITVMLIVQLFATHGSLHVRPLTLVADIVKQYLFGFFSGSPVNGFHIGGINADVAWSLAYEASFYVLLPALALIALTRFSWAVVLLIAVIPLIHHPWYMAFAFIPGILTAEIMAGPGRGWLQKHGAAIAIAALVLLVLYQFAAPNVLFDIASKPTPGVIVDLVLLGIMFSGIVASERLPLLRAGALRYLGAISYSVYLIHGIVLYFVFQAASALFHGPTLTFGSLFVLGMCVAVLTIGLSTLTYCAFERPFFVKAARAPEDTSAIVVEALAGGR